ncbi:hypothetical protein DYG63_05070 [Yersinia enterocolitica]|nr:hypothetical protein [Yersinia enterocolitica]
MMNNIEEPRKHCKEMMAVSRMPYAYIPASSIITLIDRIVKAEKERDDLLNQEFQQRLANAEHQLYMKDLAIHNIKASRKAQFRKRLAAEAELSAANEKLSKPVVLPIKYNPAVAGNKSTRANFIWHNDAISYCADAIKAAGFTVEE